MKKSMLILMAAAFTAVVSGAGIAIEIDGRPAKIKFSEVKGLKFRYPTTGENKEFYLEFYDPAELPLNWTEYSISFVPAKTGYVVLGLTATYPTKKGMDDWVEYDKFEVENGKLRNPSFELMSTKGDLFAWRYYTKRSEKLDRKDAPDGKNYVASFRGKSIRQGLYVTAGKPVTVKFLARSGGMTPQIKEEPYYSDQSAPQAK
ncbi:MAG: hypothetical protein IJS01_02530 [Lentisphaeria bacterium]|nr:hypothetical protein [Lentisphaeria bacterium]